MNDTPTNTPGLPPDPGGTPSRPANSEVPPSQASSSETFAAPPPRREGGSAGPPERIGDFTILRVLGVGGMGTVYLAEDGRLGRKAAIKTMKPEEAATPASRVRFLREARAAAAIEHDNVVPVWQVGESADGIPFIAMPFLQGETLESRLRRQPVQPAGVILKVAREVAEGLAAAHAGGLIHRDVKPSNVWVEGEPGSEEPGRQVRRCKVLDFGLAQSASPADVDLTASGTVLGTPAYMAPEQAGGGEVDHRADLFSLGVVLYRMATGRLPLAGPSVMAVLSARSNATPAPPRDLAPGLSDLIGRLMSRDPAGRPASAAAVVEAIRRLESAPVAGPGRGRTPPLVALGLLALVPLAGWLAAVALRVEADKGTLVVEVDDADAEARLEGVKLVLTGPDDEVRYTLGPGDRSERIDAGTYKVRVEGAGGLVPDTPEFTLKKGGEVTVRVATVPRAAAKDPDPDREAAGYVLSVGGTVRVNGREKDIRAVADLPKGAFRLTQFDSSNNKRVSDAGLAHFKGCKGLTHLHLDGTKVTDAGLAHFKDCKGLGYLSLYDTAVTDAGLAHLEGCKGLTGLNLYDTAVTDAGLAHLRGCKGLEHLHLGGTKVTDAGMVYLEDFERLTHLHLGGTKVMDAGLARLGACKGLTDLSLDGTAVTDAGLAHLGGCKGLTHLHLSYTKVTDAGIAHLEGCKGLTHLHLSYTKVTDAGMAHLEGCKNLTGLELQKTKVTPAGVESLKRALPKCKIEWDGGVIVPKAP